MKKKVVIGIVLVLFLIAVSGLEKGRRAEGKEQLENVLRKAAVTCYSSEGFYPPNVAYMCEHYGLQYDESRYTIYYEVFASNLMPNITVLDK